MAKYILVIKGVDDPEFQSIRDDLIEQYKSKDMEVPIITRLPQDYAEIEVVWIDEEMERESTRQALELTDLGQRAKAFLSTLDCEFSIEAKEK